MRYRADRIISRRYGTHCHLLLVPRFKTEVFTSRAYSTNPQNTKDEPSKTVFTPQPTMASLKTLAELGRQWGRNSVRTASATVNYWWEKYEEFVGLNEVREAQTKVTEAEKAFMVARGMVREAHGSLETLQVRLKEVRDRLDRVSREEAHYLELATLEHKLLQEERRLRTAYVNAEESERERFALFSVAVRESHEKERTRAERTKNWSVIGSVLGALIGVMGSTYINRVRLQELKSLLLEAQKGPVSLQEAIRVQANMHKSQETELRGLIESLGGVLQNKTFEDKGVKAISVPAPPTSPQNHIPSAFDSALKELLISSRTAQASIEGLGPQLAQLELSVGKIQPELHAVRQSIETRRIVEKSRISTRDAQMLVFDTDALAHELAQTEERLETHIKKTTFYSTVLTYTAFALTVPLLYLVFKNN